MVQITLTPEEAAALAIRGKQLGFSVSKYIRFLVAKEAHEVVSGQEVSVMSSDIEKITNEALQEWKAGKARKLTSLDDLDTP